MEILIRRFYQIKIILLLSCFRACAFLCRRRPWVIHERGTDARDNGYFFYRYMKENHPEQKLCYIIDKKSPDYPKVKDDAVQLGSLKNYWVIATAEKIISTHCFFGLPHMNPKLFRWLQLSQRFCFLQHGITKDDVAELHFDVTGVRRFICGAKPEYDFVVKEFGYPPGAVHYTGFARYDTLQKVQAKGQILIMPTWRRYISNQQEFLESAYYRRWNALLQDPQLAEFLEQQNLTAVFYPHVEMHKYMKWFQPGSERILVGDSARFDVQTLLKESSLLVTDYSSVFFDFAYMGKPVVYFQFDQDEFFEKHYSRGYFSYEDMGFGPVVESAGAVVAAIRRSADSGFLPAREYGARMENFFPLRDQENCQRIYQCIVEM